MVALRAAGDPGAAVQALRRVVRAIDPALPVYDIALLDDRLAGQERASRVLATLTAACAVLALTLAVLGLFGLLAQAVRRRTQEIGIRMALGGLPRGVLVMVLREGLWLTSVGIVCGLAGAMLLTRAMTSILFGVSPGDPAVYAGVSALLIAVAAFACWIPARRAMAVDPMIALRCE